MASAHAAAAFAPEVPFAEIDGIPLVYAGLLATATGVFVHMYCLRNEASQALDERYRLAFDEWQAQAAVARNRRERIPDPPNQPGEMLLRVPLTLSDDIGTQYRPVGASAAGSGTEWEGTWRFKPAVPNEATTLTVSIDTDESRAHGLTLPL